MICKSCCQNPETDDDDFIKNLYEGKILRIG